MDSVTGKPFEDLSAVVKTSKGAFTMDFFHDTAPLHVENFMKLARDGFYDKLTFHRYVPAFVIQGGDPEGTGSGGPGYTVPAEINPAHTHDLGAAGMARLGDDCNPKRESSGSQFYICLERIPHLDGGYTVWAKVRGGMDVVMSLRQGDLIESIEIKPTTD